MPRKPDQRIIDACKKHVDPKDVMIAFIQETPELRKKLLEDGIITEVKEEGR